MNSDPHHNNTRSKIAIASVLVGSSIFSFGDVLVKLVSSDMVLWQILVLRSILSIPALALICRYRRNAIPLLPKHKTWTLARSGLMISMWLTYYGALISLPATVAASVYYTMPIFLTLLAAVLIGDRISRLGWLAVLIGFAGAIITIRPDPDKFDLFSLLPLSSAILFALAMLITRVKLKDEHPFVLTINLHVSFFIVGIAGTYVASLLSLEDATSQVAFFTAPWKVLDIGGWFLIAVLAAVITVGNILTSIAYQNGRPATIGTLSFSYILFVGVWGFLMLGEVPAISTIVGMALIATAGYMILRA